MLQTRHNQLALSSAAFLVVFILAWLGSTLFLSFIVRKDCSKLAATLQQQHSSAVTIHDYRYQRGWLDSSIKFKLALNPPLGQALKLGFEGDALHGPLVMDWLRFRAAAAIVNFKVYVLDYRTEQRLGYLGKASFRVSFNGKIRSINWPRHGEVKLENGTFVSWQQLDFKLCYLPQYLDHPSLHLDLADLQIQNQQHNYHILGLSLASNDTSMDTLRLSGFRLDSTWEVTNLTLQHAKLEQASVWQAEIGNLVWSDLVFQDVSLRVKQDINLDSTGEQVPDLAVAVEELKFNTSSGHTALKAAFNGSSDSLNFWSPFSTYHFQGEFSMPKALATKLIAHFPKLRGKSYMQPIIRELNAPKGGDKVKFNWLKTHEKQVYQARSVR